MKILWLLVASLVAMVLVTQAVSAFNVTVPSDPLNRFINHGIGSTYTTYSSVHVPGEPGVISTFNVPYDFKAGEFEVFLDPGEYYVTWLICPQDMTGDICSRPPMISENQIPRKRCDYNRTMMNDPDNSALYDRIVTPTVTFDNVNGPYTIGGKPIYPESDCCMKGMTFDQAVPTGRSYPSKGDWYVPYNGTRYYSEVMVPDYREPIDDPYPSNPYPDSALRFLMDESVAPGKYVLHIQEKYYDPSNNADPSKEGDYGAVNVEITIKNGEISAAVVGGNSFPYSDQAITIEGYNFDSEATYLWITGPGLPKCGVNLTPINPNNPYRAPVNRIPTCNSTMTDNLGFWQVYQFDPSDLTIGPGSYTIYYSSVNPDDPVMGCRQCSGVGMTGICALEDCPICGVFGSFTLNLGYPEITASIDPVERCCCPGQPCGTIGGREHILLRGNSEGDFADTVENKTLQLWMFGEGMIGDKKFLFKEMPYLCNGNFTYDLNTELLAENNIGLCDLNPGTYYVVLQTPMYNKIFDVTLQSKAKGGTPISGSVGQEYVVTTFPVMWSKSFVISGIDEKKGLQALDALKEALDNPGIDDDYVVASFTIEDNACVRSVDFTAFPMKGKAPLKVQFTGKASFEATTWSWDFGDGTTSAEQNPSHEYENPGFYTVTITADDGTGDPRSNVKYSIIEVTKPFGVDFNYIPTYITTTTDVSFIDNSSSKPTSWFWDFGDGNTSPLQSPVHRFGAPGVYDVSLTVSDEISSSNKAVKQVLVVHDPPTAAFSANPVYSEYFPATITFTDESTGYVSSWDWQISRAGSLIATSAEKNPVITINEPGIYSVTLTVANDGGSDEETKLNFITVGSGNTIHLQPGWNHVSVPKAVTADYDTVAELFAGVDTGGVPYAVFSTAENNWTPVSDDYPVKPLEALRVNYVSGPAEISPVYVDGGTFTRQLAIGWNGIGITEMQPTPAYVVLASLGESWDKVLEYNPGTQRWEYPIIRGVDDDKLMDPTVGYLIQMNTDAILIGGEV